MFATKVSFDYFIRCLPTNQTRNNIIALIRTTFPSANLRVFPSIHQNALHRGIGHLTINNLDHCKLTSAQISAINSPGLPILTNSTQRPFIIHPYKSNKPCHHKNNKSKQSQMQSPFRNSPQHTQKPPTSTSSPTRCKQQIEFEKSLKEREERLLLREKQLERKEQELQEKLDQASALYKHLEKTMENITEQATNLSRTIAAHKIDITYLFESNKIIRQLFSKLTAYPLYQQATNAFNHIGLQHLQNQSNFKKLPNEPSNQQQTQNPQLPQTCQQQTHPEKQQFQPQEQNALIPQQHDIQPQHQHIQNNQQSTYQQLQPQQQINEIQEEIKQHQATQDESFKKLQSLQQQWTRNKETTTAQHNNECDQKLQEQFKLSTG